MPKEKNDGIVADDLQKSLDKLSEFASQGDQKTRKEQLLAKANETELEKSEAEELYRLLGGEPDEQTSLGDDLVKSMMDDSYTGLQEALDVAPYLRDLHDGLEKSYRELGDHVEQADRRTHEVLMLQSKALVEMGGLVKSMHERLEVIEGQPVRGPKSKGLTTDDTLNKSFADNGGGAGDTELGELTKSQIADAMDAMMIESVDGGNNGLSKSGQDIGLQITNFEMSSKISPPMLADVKDFISRRKAAH